MTSIAAQLLQANQLPARSRGACELKATQRVQQVQVVAFDRNGSRLVAGAPIVLVVRVREARSLGTGAQRARLCVAAERRLHVDQWK